MHQFYILSMHALSFIFNCLELKVSFFTENLLFPYRQTFLQNMCTPEIWTLEGKKLFKKREGHNKNMENVSRAKQKMDSFNLGLDFFGGLFGGYKVYLAEA